MPSPTTVRLLLLDADAVIQRMPEGWLEGVLAQVVAGWKEAPEALTEDPAVWGRARAVLDEIFLGEVSILSGAQDDPTFPELVGEVLAAHDNTADPEAMARNWHQTLPLAEERAAVAAARRRGIRVVMATNQQPHRAAWLESSGAFADLADEVYTSSRLGVAKPSPAFFRSLLDAEAAAGFPVEPGEAVFVDDRAENVDGAAEVGIVARRYHFTEGSQRFTEVLQSVGVLEASTADDTASGS